MPRPGRAAGVTRERWAAQRPPQAVPGEPQQDHCGDHPQRPGDRRDEPGQASAAEHGHRRVEPVGRRHGERRGRTNPERGTGAEPQNENRDRADGNGDAVAGHQAGEERAAHDRRRRIEARPGTGRCRRTAGRRTDRNLHRVRLDHTRILRAGPAPPPPIFPASAARRPCPDARRPAPRSAQLPRCCCLRHTGDSNIPDVARILTPHSAAETGKGLGRTLEPGCRGPGAAPRPLHQ